MCVHAFTVALDSRFVIAVYTADRRPSFKFRTNS